MGRFSTLVRRRSGLLRRKYSLAGPVALLLRLELSSSVLRLRGSHTIPVPQMFPSTNFPATLYLPITNSASLSSSLKFNLEMCKKYVKSAKRLHSCVASVSVPVPDRTTAVGDNSDVGLALRVFPVAGVSNECEEHSGVREGKNETEGVQGLDTSKMLQMCDKMIDVFLVDFPNASDWRKCLAFSKQWSIVRLHFFRHCQEKAFSEKDPGIKQRLLRLERKIKEIDDDVQRHNDLIDVVKSSSSDVTDIVCRRRKDFTKEFFEHLQLVATSHDDVSILDLGNECLAAVQCYDAASEAEEALDEEAFYSSGLTLQDIVASDPALAKIDDLAIKNQLDSTLAMNISKAWATGKYSNMSESEAREMAIESYLDAVAYDELPMPKELRILKYVVSFEDSMQQLSILRDAFTPGEEVETEIVDMVYTTPEKLLSLIVAMLGYHMGAVRKLHWEAELMVTPEMVQELQKLKNLIERYFI